VTKLRPLFFVVLLALILPARANEVVFPAGSRIGIAPPPGTVESRSFMGFEDPSRNVAITVTGLPPEAYPQIEQSITRQQPGVTIERRESLTLAAGKAVLLVAHQLVDGIGFHRWILAASAGDLTAVVTFQIPDDARNAYPDDALRSAAGSLAIRPSVPIEEQLGLLPFKVAELAGFQVAGVLPGRSLMLASEEGRAQLVVSVMPGGPVQANDRALFANDVFAGIPNLRDVRIFSSEPLRIGGQQGYQIMARGKDASTGADLTIVQWMRFGAGVYMHILGAARTEDWTAAYPRFRQVRDGIDAP